MKVYKQVIALSTDCAYALSFIEYKNALDAEFKISAKEIMEILNCKRTHAFKVLKTLKENNYLIKESGYKGYSINIEKLSGAYVSIKPTTFNDKTLSINAKILYSEMASLTKLSEKNGWSDELGTYIKFSYEKICSLLNCCNATVSKTLNELYDKELITVCNNYANKYYICSKKVRKAGRKMKQIKEYNNNIYIKKNIKEKNRKEVKLSKSVSSSKTEEEQEKYAQFVSTFARKIGGKKFKVTKYLARLIDNFYEHYTINDLVKILDKIICNTFLKGWEWVKNIYHFLEKDIFIKIETGYYNSYKTNVNKNKFNDFNQRTYSQEFLYSFYDNL